MTPTCGSMQRMYAGYCEREPGHHGPCRTDEGRIYYQATLRHPEGCAACTAEEDAIIARRAARVTIRTRRGTPP